MKTSHNQLKFKKNPLALAVCLLSGSVFSSAMAQETPAENEEAAGEREERITVVGSRIRSDGLERSTPVTVINASDAAAQGFNSLGDLLRSSTVAAGSSQVTAATSSAVTSGGTGVETLSLRGLGANRTLVLLNGRRAGPAGTRGEVSAFDMNTLPLAAIDRIEILKDGASSLYGSDAVAGVVNIITKKGDESSFNLNHSSPLDSGGESYRANFTFGRSTGKGSFRVVADYKLDEELALGQRDFFACSEDMYFDPETGERSDTIDPRTGNPRCNDLPWGHLWTYDYGGPGGAYQGMVLAQYDYDGDLGQYIDRDGGPISTDGWADDWFPVNYDRPSDGVTNGDHPFQDLESLNPKQETATIYLQGDYDLSRDVKLYSEVLFNRRETTSNSYRQFWAFRYSSDFDGTGFGDPAADGFTGPQVFSPTAITDHSGDKITVDYRRVVVGAEGYLGDWFWDVSYQDSLSDGDYQSKIIYEDAITPYDLSTSSCEGTTTAIRGVPCVDVPWFDPNFLAGDITGDVRDFLFGSEIGNTEYEQRTFEAYMSGDLFSLPAGMVAVAFGGSYQEDSIVDTPGEQTLAANTWGSTSAGITAGESDTKALFAEVQIPLLYDLPFVDQLDLTLSTRWTDVSTYGDDTTYKMGLNWAVNDSLRLRASRGTSFRSPALYELFLNDQTSFANQRAIDPCVNWETNLDEGSVSETLAANCASAGVPGDWPGGNITATVSEGGGAGVLEAETSDSLTYGFVWIPYSSGFSMSVDYFDIDIDGEVTSLTPGQITSRCFNSEDFANEPLCAQIEREQGPDDFSITEVTGGYLNIANQINRGVDFNFGYQTETPIGELRLGYEHTIQIEASRQLFADSIREDYTGEIGNPKNVGNFTAELAYNDWRYNWTVRYLDKTDNYERYGNGEYDDTVTYRGEEQRVLLEAGSFFYHAFSATKAFDSGIEATLGVANAFDKEPPRVSAPAGSNIVRRGSSAFYSQYDWLGRRVFFNLAYNF